MTIEKDECWSRDGENYSYQTLGDLLDSHDDLKPGDTVYVGTPIRPDPTTFIEADDVIATLSDRAYDECGEYAEDFPDVTIEAKAELDALLDEWVHKHCHVTFYSVEDTREYTVTAEDIEGVPAETQGATPHE